MRLKAFFLLGLLAVGCSDDGEDPPAQPALDGSAADARTLDGGPPDATPDAVAPPPSSERAEVLTQRYDNARTGANLGERKLAPATLSSLKALGSWSVDGEIYAQVLVAADVMVAGVPRALAIVATMNDSIYAFDADASPDQPPIWQQGSMRELGYPAFSQRNVGGLNGILSTPVIDKARGHLYAVARDCDPTKSPEAPSCKQRLVRLALATGEVLASLPITGRVTVDASTAPREVVFDPSAHWNRPGLLLVRDELYIAFGSGPAGNQHEEDFVYHGWMFRYQLGDLGRAPSVHCTTPRGRGGSIWQAGAAPAADEGAVYATGANGIQLDSMTHPAGDWPSAPLGQEDSVYRLSIGAPFPTPDEPTAQYADTRPYLADGNVFQYMESGDNGFGSSGPTLIPDSKLMLLGTKAGLVYLLDRETMRATQDPLNPFTTLPLQPGHSLYLHSWWGIPAVTQNFVFWRPRTSEGRNYGYAFAWPLNDKLRTLRFDYSTGALSLFATSDAPGVKGAGNMVLSADGDDADSGILWVSTGQEGTRAGLLRAFDPHTLEELWRSETPAWSKFTPPTVVRGRVYLPATAPGQSVQRVMVYGQ